MNKIEVDVKKYIDFMLVGEKVTSYSDPLKIENIKDYNNIVTIYTQQMKSLGLCLAFEKETFLKAIKEYKEQ